MMSTNMSMNLIITIHRLSKMKRYPVIYRISTVRDPIVMIPIFMATILMKSYL